MAERSIIGFSGAVNTLPAERLADGFSIPGAIVQEQKPAELVKAENVDFDDSGYMSMRSGFEVRVAGVFSSLWSDGDFAFVVQEGVLKRVWSDLTMTPVASGVGEDVSFLRVADRVYWSDGESGSGVVSNSFSRSWGLPHVNPSNIVQIPGILKAGKYLVSIVYERSDGQLGGSGASHPVSLPDASGIRVSWDIENLPNGADFVVLYVSTTDGKVLYRATRTASIEGVTEFTGGLQSLQMDTQFLSMPPYCHHMTLYKGRIYLAVGTAIYATTSLGYELCDLRDFIVVDGSRITMLKAVDTGIFVGTDNGVSFLKGNTLSEMDVSAIRESGVIVGSDVYADGDKVTGKADLAGIHVVIFTTSTGVLVGLPDGGIVNLTYDKYRFDALSKASAVFRDSNELHQYIVLQQ